MTEEIQAESQQVTETHLRTSRNAWNHGKHARIAAYKPKGIASKETVETRSFGNKLFCYDKISWTFRRHHVFNNINRKLHLFGFLLFSCFIYLHRQWLDQQVLGWLNHIYACKQTASQLASVGAFRDRLRHFIYETYARSLIAQFFDIIIDYPDSKPAIMDLSACLEKTDLRSELVTTLKHALENRLLHPGRESCSDREWCVCLLKRVCRALILQ